MGKTIMKYIGVIIMIFAAPVGYFFWSYVIWKYLANSMWYMSEQNGILIGVGIMEIFLTGLSLFVIGSIREEKKK